MAKRIGKYKVSKSQSALSLVDGGAAFGIISNTSGFHNKNIKLMGPLGGPSLEAKGHPRPF